MARFGLIPGDGIGVEVVAEVQGLLDALRRLGSPVEWQIFDYGAERYLAAGEALPPGAMEELGSFDALLAGAFGGPRVPDMAHAREILLGLRRHLDLYANLRPCKPLADSLCPVRTCRGSEVDLLVVRENTEGAYVDAGGTFKRGTPDELAVQEAVATRKGVERILVYAFQLALEHPSKRLHMADKHNALTHVGGLWHRTFQEIRERFPAVESRHIYVDALCHDLVRDPSRFGVIVTSNLFGDLVSDIGAALAGGLGVAPSGNVNPRTRKALFEPVHGSAPDLAGKGVANPVAALLSAAMMLEWAELAQEGARVRRAVRECVAAGETTPDLGGGLSTRAVGEAVRRRL
jgi:3-isopropylmalate dehydrogenase